MLKSTRSYERDRYGYYNYGDKDVKWLYCVYNSHRGYLCRAYLRRVQA